MAFILLSTKLNLNNGKMCCTRTKDKCQTKWCCLSIATKGVQGGDSQSVSDGSILQQRAHHHGDPRPWRPDATPSQRLRYGQPLTPPCGPNGRYALIRTGCSIHLPTAKHRYRKGALNGVIGEILSTGNCHVWFAVCLDYKMQQTNC